MSEQTTLNQQRGEIVTSVEPDAVFLEARNAHIQADAAYAKALEALDASQLVSANAANALSQATTAISLANTAQTTANNALATQVSVTGATMTGPIYLSSTSPSVPYEAAAKAYVDAQVATVATDAINSVAVLKADKTYVDNQNSAQNTTISTHTSQIADLYSKLFPPGGIIMWSGLATAIPSGWVLCNGANGTPDLRNRFIVGAGSTYNVGAAGGATSVTSGLGGSHFHSFTTEQSGAHSHTITVNDHTLSIAQIPPHSHTFTYNQNNVDSSGGANRAQNIAATGYGIGVTTTSQGGGQPHKHGASASAVGTHGHTGDTAYAGDHNHTVATLPPYYALCFIMKT